MQKYLLLSVILYLQIIGGHSANPAKPSTPDCPHCVDESQYTNKWTMPLLKLGEKRYYLGIFFKLHNFCTEIIIKSWESCCKILWFNYMHTHIHTQHMHEHS
ncbi:unnamed protein product [Ceratitis capitata]|uniref:(Mediterranean fruit fly) hypothetical protein n=1 Tax=Ceratitis capitata TaxID=7213 RepID=A0A811UTC2_CERCA|nr:unnamed protein product [Ceratitis capitata]